ncbi:unnamed protein product, partial [Urochloa humidicola]
GIRSAAVVSFDCWLQSAPIYSLGLSPIRARLCAPNKTTVGSYFTANGLCFGARGSRFGARAPSRGDRLVLVVILPDRERDCVEID